MHVEQIMLEECEAASQIDVRFLTEYEDQASVNVDLTTRILPLVDSE